MKSKYVKITVTCTRKGGEKDDVDLRIDTNSKDGAVKLSDDDRAADMLSALMLALLSMASEFGYDGDELFAQLKDLCDEMELKVVEDEDDGGDDEDQAINNMMGLFYRKGKELN